MFARLILLAVSACLLLSGCDRTTEDEWRSYTGSPEKPPAAATLPNAAASNPNELRGCLSGTERDFTLVEAGTATTYRITAGEPDPLKLNVGRVVALTGERQPPMAGVPTFFARDVSKVADVCPPALAGGTNTLNRPPLARVGIAQNAPIHAPVGYPTPGASSVPAQPR